MIREKISWKMQYWKEKRRSWGMVFGSDLRRKFLQYISSLIGLRNT